MLFLLLSILFAVAVMAYWRSMEPFLRFIFGVVLAMVLFITTSITYDAVSQSPYKVSQRRDLVALADGSGTTGQFGLFSGVIKDRSYYIYYYSQNGVIRQGRVDVDEATITEGQGPPELITYSDPGDGWNWIGLRFGLPDHYEFHVPKGTVVQQYKLDLGN